MNVCQSAAVDKLVLKASEMFNLPATEITGKFQKRKHCIARELIWVVCKKELYLTFREIGTYFDRRDHKTVHSGFTQMKDELEVCSDRQKSYKELVNG